MGRLIAQLPKALYMLSWNPVGAPAEVPIPEMVAVGEDPGYR